MVPVLGLQKAIHYRHLKAACSFESYLHHTSKQAIYQRLNHQAVVPLIIHRAAQCHSLKSKILTGCAAPCQLFIPAIYNLKALFDGVELEGYDRATGLRPDVLLTNSVTGAKCYIEIHVSHACTPEKIATGVPILEFFIQSQTDIDALIQDEFRVNQEALKAYNFRPAPHQLGECHPNCLHRGLIITTWHLSSQGRLQRHGLPFSDYTPDPEPQQNVWPENLPSKEQLQRLKEITMQSTVPNRTCINCISALDWAGGLVECGKKNSHVNYKEAMICSAYRLHT